MWSAGLRRAEVALAHLSAVAIFAMMLLISVDVLSRYLLGNPIMGAVEFTEEYLMVAAVFLALSWTSEQGGHVRVELVVRRLPAHWQARVYAIVNALAGIVFAVITALAASTAVDAWHDGVTSSSSLAYPMAPIYVLIAVGTLSLTLRLLLAAFHATEAGTTKEAER